MQLYTTMLKLLLAFVTLFVKCYGTDMATICATYYPGMDTYFDSNVNPLACYVYQPIKTNYQGGVTKFVLIFVIFLVYL
jgi:hypothetical protein